MGEILIGGMASLLICMFLGPKFIGWLRSREFGQHIREDGPDGHHEKAGTPTMGGALILLSLLLPTVLWADLRNPFVLATTAVTAGYGVIGYLDDYLKIKRKSSGGLPGRYKLLGQALIGGAAISYTFGVVPGNLPADWVAIKTQLALPFVAFSRVSIDLPLEVYIPFAVFVVVATSNAVNLTDGLDGLATGTSVMVCAAYMVVAAWQLGQSCEFMSPATPKCYEVRDSRDLAVVAAALLGACFGFLWWNAAPAKIFMGDTGSLALGGAIAGLAITTRTELLLVLLGGLFAIITTSVIVQVGWFKATGKRVFRMAPLQHHFELKGWGEVTIVIRFWIIAGLCVALGLGVFYADWVAR